eukprot:gb/GECG01003467.1/.p1 GENE.gb/GECG01003467.1/~~gb/GECG01003467.1/.p1  ORF type:complete len:149 (+),score=19.04 gb/GECG01003467.1/:1-447(+)
MDRLLNKWDAMEWKRVLDVIFKSVGNAYLRGRYFEGAMHKLIPQRASKAPLREFPNVVKLVYGDYGWEQKAKESTLFLPTSKEEKIVGTKIDNVVAKAINVRANGFGAVYGKPTMKIFETVDAILVTSAMAGNVFQFPLLLFQYSVIR